MELHRRIASILVLLSFPLAFPSAAQEEGAPAAQETEESEGPAPEALNFTTEHTPTLADID